MNRRVIVIYDVGGSTNTDVFSAQRSIDGDIAITATKHGPVHLRMRDGKDAHGNRVIDKLYIHAYSVEVREI